MHLKETSNLKNKIGQPQSHPTHKSFIVSKDSLISGGFRCPALSWLDALQRSKGRVETGWLQCGQQAELTLKSPSRSLRTRSKPKEEVTLASIPLLQTIALHAVRIPLTSQKKKREGTDTRHVYDKHMLYDKRQYESVRTTPFWVTRKWFCFPLLFSLGICQKGNWRMQRAWPWRLPTLKTWNSFNDHENGNALTS